MSSAEVPATAVRPGSPLRAFVSYAHEDEGFREELSKHLRTLTRRGVLEVWHDRRIEPGQDWAREIDEALEEADLVLLLISADFIDSDYCCDIEMDRALERHEAGECRVVPIIVRDCDFSGSRFAGLQALPKDARPVKSWDDRDEAWADVARRIRRLCDELRGGASESEPRPDRAVDSPEDPRRAWPSRWVVVATLVVAVLVLAGVGVMYSGRRSPTPPPRDAGPASDVARKDVAPPPPKDVPDTSPAPDARPPGPKDGTTPVLRDVRPPSEDTRPRRELDRCGKPVRQALLLALGRPPKLGRVESPSVSLGVVLSAKGRLRRLKVLRPRQPKKAPDLLQRTAERRLRPKLFNVGRKPCQAELLWVESR